MKNLKYIIASLVLLLVSNVQAQTSGLASEIDWEAYAKPLESILSDNATVDYGKAVYLYNVKEKKFLTAGGDYAAQPVLADIGMLFYITKAAAEKMANNGCYNIHSNIDNKGDNLGDCMGIGVAPNAKGGADKTVLYIDRSNIATTGSTATCPDWIITLVDGTTRQYTFLNANVTGENKKGKRFNGITLVDGAIKTCETAKTDSWYFVDRETYINAIINAADQMLDISGLILDGGFVRNEKNQAVWNNGDSNPTDWYQIGIEEDPNYTSNISNLILDNGKYFTAEIYGVGALQQTIEGLTPGNYVVECKAFTTGNQADGDPSGQIFANNVSVGINPCAKQFENNLGTYKTKYGLKDEYLHLSANIAAGEIFATTGEQYLMNINVKVGEDGKLTIGFENLVGGDLHVFAVNFKLYYIGTSYETYYSANSTTITDPQWVDPLPVTMNLRRSFDINKWNAICLPYNLTAAQVQQAFGTKDAPARLSKLVGINPNHPTQILFEKADELIAGECYVVYVTKEPDVEAGTTISYLPGANLEGSIVGRQEVVPERTITGPIYTILNKQRTQDEIKALDECVNNDGGVVSKEVNPGAGALRFTGYYTKPKNGGDNVKYPKESYIINDGKMYYLSGGEWGTIYATMWYLQDVDPSRATALTLNINGVGDSTTTAIGEIAVVNGQNIENGNIYNINGQLVNKADNLKKGVYIVNGRKIVVK